MINLIFSLFFYLFNIEGSIDIYVLDIDTKKPIPYVTVLSPSFNGMTNEHGMIKVSQNVELISFSCIGYESNQLDLKETKLGNGCFTVFLKQKTYSIPEVAVNAFRVRKMVRGYYRGRARASHFSSWGGQVALFFPPEKKMTNLPIGTVSYFVGNEGNFRKKFRVRIYSVKPYNGEPFQDILPEAVYARSEKGNEWVTIRVKHYGIVFPENGMFVALEFLPDSTQILKDYFYSQDNRLNIGVNFEDKNNGRTWAFNFNTQKWVQELPLHKDQIVGNAMIKLELFEEIKK